MRIYQEFIWWVVDFDQCRTVVTFTNVVPSTTLPNRNSAETSPASHGVASARPSLFSCFFLKLPFQKMARSAPLEVRPSQKSRREEKGFLKLWTLRVFCCSVCSLLLRALSLGLQDCAHREPPGTRTPHQSRLQWGNVSGWPLVILRDRPKSCKKSLF